MTDTDRHQPTIAEIVQQSGGDFDGNGCDFDILLQALIAADLVGAVSDPHDDLTVFAPTDAAFIELARSLGAEVEDGDDAAAFDAIVAALTELGGGDPIPLLKDVLLYHVSDGGRTVEQLQHDGTIETKLGETFHVDGKELNDKDPDIENPEFIKELTNIKASNGVIQGIDRVLLPIDLPPAKSEEPEPTIADIVALSGGEFDGDGSDFDILLNALQAAGLVEAVSDPHDDLTVFAPTDDAFIELARSLGAEVEDGDDAAAFNAIVATLTELGGGDPIPLLKEVLLYHVSDGGRTVEQLQDDGTVETKQGETIHVDGHELDDKEPDLENPEFIEGLTDIEVSNGVIQGIDRVLLPVDLPGGPTNPDGDDPIVVESEDMHLYGYRVEHDEDASGDALIKLSGRKGVASTTFEGESGNYDLQLHYFDEIDGRAKISVLVNGEQVERFRLDEKLGGRTATAENATSITIEGLHLEQGDKIDFVGRKKGYEFARMDKIVLTSADDEDDPLEGNSLTEDMLV